MTPFVLEVLGARECNVPLRGMKANEEDITSVSPKLFLPA